MCWWRSGVRRWCCMRGCWNMPRRSSLKPRVSTTASRLVHKKNLSVLHNLIYNPSWRGLLTHMLTLTQYTEISQGLKLTLNYFVSNKSLRQFTNIYCRQSVSCRSICTPPETSLLYLWFLQDLPDVQELIAEVSAEKYSLQAAAILGEGTFWTDSFQARPFIFFVVYQNPFSPILFRLTLCTSLRKCLCFRHWWDCWSSFSAAGERQQGKRTKSTPHRYNNCCPWRGNSSELSLHWGLFSSVWEMVKQ